MTSSRTSRHGLGAHPDREVGTRSSDIDQPTAVTLFEGVGPHAVVAVECDPLSRIPVGVGKSEKRGTPVLPERQEDVGRVGCATGDELLPPDSWGKHSISSPA